MIHQECKSKKWSKWVKVWTRVLAYGLIFFNGVQTAQAIPNGGYAHPEILIQPEELKSLLDKKDPRIRVIDVRDRSQYLKGHIPGSVQIWRPEIEDKDHPLPGMMASKERMEDLMGNLGIGDKDTLVIYSDGPDNGRLWWVMAYYGFPLQQMRLLDGSLDAWKAKDYPIEVLSPKIEKTRFKLPEKAQERGPLLCTLPEVKSALKKNPNQVVLDVRSKKEFLGEETRKGAPQAGRIPGVTWIEWKEVLFEEGPYKGYWKSGEEIRTSFSAKGITPDKEIYIY